METKIIPTAKEYLLKTIFPTSFVNKPDEVELWFNTNQDYKESVEIMIEFAKLHVDYKESVEIMIEFAKLHVQQALKEASQQAEIYNKPKFSGDYNLVVDEDSILNSYPLEKIK